MRSYLQHGSRHAPGGSDPIPGLGGSSGPVIAAGRNFSGQTVTGGTTQNCSFTSTAYSSDSSKLLWTTTTLTNDTLVIVGVGFAMLTASCRWTGGTNVDFKINTGSGFEMFGHDAIKSFSGFGTASSGSTMPTLMDICWVDTTATSLPVFVKMTNGDVGSSGPSDASLACVFYPGIT